MSRCFLRPAMLYDFGLVPALKWYAREMTKRTGLNVVVEADHAADNLPDEHKTCILRAPAGPRFASFERTKL